MKFSLWTLLPGTFAIAILFALSVPRTNHTSKTAPAVYGQNVVHYTLNDEVQQYQQLRSEVVQENDLFYVTLWMGERFENRLSFVLKDEEIQPGAFTMDDPNKRYILLQHQATNCVFTSDTYYNGMLVVEHLDKVKGMLAGSFEFLAYSDHCQEVLRVTQGSFDIQYLPNSY